jgi:hypothetical protein
MSNSIQPPETITARDLLEPLVQNPRLDICFYCVKDLVNILGTHEVTASYPIVDMWRSDDYRVAFDYCAAVVGFGETPSTGVVEVPLLAILESKDLDRVYALAQDDDWLDPFH